MKKSLLFSAVLAGLMLGSCSSSDDIAGTSEKFSADGKGYVNVTLNLPTQPQSTSRAINDEFDHGVPDEYKVKMLLLFFLRVQTKQQQLSRLLISWMA